MSEKSQAPVSSLQNVIFIYMDNCKYIEGWRCVTASEKQLLKILMTHFILKN